MKRLTLHYCISISQNPDYFSHIVKIPNILVMFFHLMASGKKLSHSDSVKWMIYTGLIGTAL